MKAKVFLRYYLDSTYFKNMKINCKHCDHDTTSNGKIYIKNGYRLRFACKACLKITLTDDKGAILNARQLRNTTRIIEYRDLLNVINNWIRSGFKQSY